jgi:hypothetical protein
MDGLHFSATGMSATGMFHAMPAHGKTARLSQTPDTMDEMDMTTTPPTQTAATLPATSVTQWLSQWLMDRFPADFIAQASLPGKEPRFPAPVTDPALEDLSPVTGRALPNQPPPIERTLSNGVTVVANQEKNIKRLDTLLKRMQQRLGRPLIEHIKLVIDDHMGDIGQRNGTGNQAAYQNTRDAASGKIFQETLHINTQFLDYLSRQPISKAEAYLAAVLFHEQSHRDVLKAAEQQNQFHRISQSDEKNANERAEAGIAQFYPEYYSWLRQNYFGLFREHFTEAYGGLPVATDADLNVIKAGNRVYNQRFFEIAHHAG